MIEVICLTKEEALMCQGAGIGRIELIDNFEQGGLTPSREIMEAVIESVSIPVNVMIRPHSDNFVYSKKEIDQMCENILQARLYGANGVVLGVLDEDGHVDETILAKLLGFCKGLEVTFHRAIDESFDIFRTTQELTNYPQITRILTSGGQGKAIDHLEQLRVMMKLTEHSRIEIMPGSGINLENIREIESLKPIDIHVGTAVRYGGKHDGELDKSLLELLSRYN